MIFIHPAGRFLRLVDFARHGLRRAAGLRPRAALAGLAVFAWGFDSAPAQDASSGGVLHERINAWCAEQIGPSDSNCGDEEFLRRASLALTGMIPSLEEARGFLVDSPGDPAAKRRGLVERCLDSPDWARHMAVTFDVMLMERRADTHVNTLEWRSFLQEQFRQNRPFDELVRTILTSDGADEALRPASRFHLAREAEPHALTRDIGRLFLGIDLQCAQCHDHPRIDDYRQRDYYGIHAFLTRTYLFQPDTNKPAVVGENADGEAAYSSVFTKLGDTAPPRLPGRAPFADPPVEGDQKWNVAPDEKDKNLRPVPKFSRRAELAAQLTSAENRAFARNLANRLWAHMMGRGLIEPLDLAHAENPPAHPDLLEIVTDGVVALKFDIKAILRELALTDVFQRGFDLPALQPETVSALAAREAELASRLADAANTADGSAAAFKAQRDALNETLRQVEELRAAAKAKADALAAVRKEIEPLDKALAEANAALEPAKAKADALAAAAQATEAAIDSAPSPDEIRKALATLTAQHDQAAAAVAPLEQAQATAAEARQAKAEPLAAAESELATAAAAASAGEMTLAEARAAADNALAARNASRSRQQHITRMLEEVRSVQAWVDAVHARDAAASSLAMAEANHADVTARAKALASAADVLEAELPALRSRAAAAESQLSAAMAAMTAADARLHRLADAATKARAAAEIVGDDAELAAAIEILAAQTEAMRTESAEAAARLEETNSHLQELQAVAASSEDQLAAVLEAREAMRRDEADAESRCQAAAAAAQQSREALESAEAALTDAWSRSFTIRPLVPLTPEQLAWSMLRATGQWENLRAAAEAEHAAKVAEAEKKAAELAAQPPAEGGEAKPAEPIPSVDALFEQKIRGNTDQFVRLFGSGTGQPQSGFFATADQALYFENADVPRAWLVGGGSSLVEHLMKLNDPTTVARDLYLGILTRIPTGEEAAAAVAHLESRGDQKLEAIQDLGWALLTSSEFRFNH